MTTIVRRSPTGLLPDFDEMFDNVLPFAWRTPFAEHQMRVEEFTDGGDYVLRAELPGIDPAKDLDITVSDRVLTIKAERSERKHTEQRSEFRYGSFVRSMSLPARADESAITAAYQDGILTIVMKLGETPPAARKIEVSTG